MPRAAPPAVPVALLGFSDFERMALDAALSRARRMRGGPDYTRVLSVDEADYVVADGDDAGSQALLEELGRVGDTVFVGLQAPPEAAAWVMRPVTPERVLRELDELHRARSSPDSAPLPWTLPSDFDSGFALLDAPAGGAAVPPMVHLDGPSVAGGAGHDARPYVERRAAPRGERQASRRAADRHAALWARPSGPVPLAPLQHHRALVVDDSAIARYYLERLLRPYGLEVDTVDSAEAARLALDSERYGIVFVDLDLGEGQRHAGLKLCRQIRLEGRPDAEGPPLVVMVSAFHDPVDQVRGTLAGAEAYLGKPLDTQVLDRLLRSLGFESKAATAAPAARRLQQPGLAGR